MLGAMLGAIQTPINFDRRDARRDPDSFDRRDPNAIARHWKSLNRDRSR
jgi:hypothetical protein